MSRSPYRSAVARFAAEQSRARASAASADAAAKARARATPFASATAKPAGTPGWGAPAAPAAASAPSSSAVSGSAPLPVDPAYDARIAAATKQRDQQLAALAANRQQGLLNYGYTENPNGGALAFDPSNPYSQAALMKRSYDQSRAGSVNSMAARGQLYAGALTNQQDELNSRQSQASDGLQKQLAQFLADNSSGRSAAGVDFLNRSADAASARVRDAPENVAYSPALPAPGPDAGSAAAPASRVPLARRVKPFASAIFKPAVTPKWGVPLPGKPARKPPRRGAR